MDSRSSAVRPRSWRQIETLFFEAIALPPEARERLLAAACCGDPELRADVESLLANDTGNDDALSLALSEAAARALGGRNLAGDRLGAYRVLREIGRGGMGTVYLAVRDDDHYRKQVAIKVVKWGMDTADVLRRFRHERQILAGLEHTHIARLLDGGSTPDGRPFLVMELVEGKPIDQFCRDRQLGVEDRCRLFLKVCDAVSYAHRKLVIHRDLKPANVLVAADGSPKLLDFGLAKILDDETDGAQTLTVARARPLTPDYASPEQLRGARLNTATDIYSLGVVLYELLAGVRPRRNGSEIPKPSAAASGEADGKRLRRRLEGDLDNIVMMAMREEIERRYASVDELAADVRRHLESRPVAARQDSIGYRTLKFLRRRRFPVLAAAVTAASLLGGMVIATTQAREAEAARKIAETRRNEAEQARRTAEAEHRRAERERDEAVVQRQRAEDRLAEILSLSDRSLSGVDTLLERVAGSADARREIVRTTLDALETLSKQGGADPRLQIALAKAYLALGELQRDPRGDIDGALKSYRAGAAFLADTPRASTPDRERLIVWLQLQIRIGEALDGKSDARDSFATFRRALDTAMRAPPALLADKQPARIKASLYLWLARRSAPDFQQARGYAMRYVEAVEALLSRFPGDADLRYDLSVGETLIAWVHTSLDDPETAAGHYETAMRIREQLVGEYPNDLMFRRTLMLAYVHYASVQGGPLEANLGHYELARTYYRKAQPLEEAAAADPKDSVGAASYGAFLLKLGALDAPPEGVAESLETLRRAAVILNAHSMVRWDIATAYNYIGRRLESEGRYSDARGAYRRALAVTEPILAAHPDLRQALEQSFEAEGSMARTLAIEGNRSDALLHARRLIRRVQQSGGPASDRRFHESFLARAYVSLSAVYRSLGDFAPGYEAAQEAIRHARPLVTGRGWDPGAGILHDAQQLAVECASKTPVDRQ
jgi:eukaryotic-like serine/threonine-protein kinase